MSFDKATIALADGGTRTLTFDEFWAIPLGDRIGLVTSGRVKFQKGDQPVSPIDAVRRR